MLITENKLRELVIEELENLIKEELITEANLKDFAKRFGIPIAMVVAIFNAGVQTGRVGGSAAEPADAEVSASSTTGQETPVAATQRPKYSSPGALATPQKSRATKPAATTKSSVAQEQKRDSIRTALQNNNLGSIAGEPLITKLFGIATSAKDDNTTKFINIAIQSAGRLSRSSPEADKVDLLARTIEEALINGKITVHGEERKFDIEPASKKQLLGVVAKFIK